MYRYTTRDVHCYLWMQDKMHCKMSVQQVSCFMHRVLQVYWRMLCLSLPIDSVGHCMRYANIKIFFEAYFPVYGQNPRTYTGKYVLEKTRIFPYFTQCDVFHWLAQKITHHWTRIIDIILKINNCKEIFTIFNCCNFVKLFFHILTF